MRNRRPRDDRGSVTIFVAVISLVLVLTASLAVDLGMQRVVRRDMQALADVVALDLARELDGRSRSELAPVIDAHDPDSALSRSVARNDGVLGDTPVVSAELGSWDGTTWNGSADPPTAVRVTATGSVDFAFFGGEGTATRQAVGSTIKSACFSVGSFAARFRSGDSALIGDLLDPMNELLRPQAHLDAVSYAGLATAYASLDEIAAAAGLGSTDQLLASTITVADLLEAVIDVLGSEQPPNSVAVSALQQIAAGSALLSTPVLLTDVVSVAPGDTAALQVDLNVLDLVAGAILLADGEHGFQLGNGNLGAGIAGVASLEHAEISVIERPQIACGPYGSAESRAETSQVSGTATARLQLPTINLGGGDIVHTSPATVELDVDLGHTVARLAGEPTCGEGTALDPDRMDVAVQSAAATLSFTTTLAFKTTLDLGLAGKVDVTWNQAASAGRAMPGASQALSLALPPNDTTPAESGTGDAGLGGATVLAVATDVQATYKTTGLSVPLNLVEPLLQPIVDALAVHARVDGTLDDLAEGIDAALSPLLTLLGLNVDGADVVGLRRPICGAPVLRG